MIIFVAALKHCSKIRIYYTAGGELTLHYDVTAATVLRWIRSTCSHNQY